MTKFIICCGALLGAVGVGYLAYAFVTWLAPSANWVYPTITSVGALLGAFLGSLLGFVVAGLIEA